MGIAKTFSKLNRKYFEFYKDTVLFGKFPIKIRLSDLKNPNLYNDYTFNLKVVPFYV